MEKLLPYIDCPFGTFWQLCSPYKVGQTLMFFSTKKEAEEALTRLMAYGLGSCETWGEVALMKLYPDLKNRQQ